MDKNDTRSSSPPIEPANLPSLPQLEEDFIILLETLPELWNAQHKYYTNKYKRQAGYEKLLEIFKKIKPQATVDDVRKKINSLRSNYRRELKKITSSKRSGAGVDDLYTPKAKTFKLLSFLYNTEKPNYSQQRQIESPGSSQENLKELINPSQETPFSAINQVVHPVEKKQKPKTLLAKQNELLDRANLFLSQTTSQSQKSKQETTTSHSLALVWAEKLDKLLPQQRFFAEKAIHDILFEAGLGNLHRFSVKINESNMNMTSAYCNASPLYPQNSSSPIPHCSSPSNSVSNPPTPSGMQYSPDAPSPSPSSLQSPTVNLPLTSTSQPSQLFNEDALSRTHYSSSPSSTPAHYLTIVPSPMTSQLQLGTNSPSFHVNSQPAPVCQKGFASQIIINPKTNATMLHIPSPSHPDTEDYTVSALFKNFNP